MINANAAAAVASAIALLLACNLSLAGSPPAAEQPQRTGSPPMEVPPINGGANDTQTVALLRVTSVEIMRSAHAPVLDIIRVRGLASSAGWEEAELVPLTRGVPPDGILRLILVARPPETAADATGYETLEAIFPLETDHPFKGVSVHAATNAVSVAPLPGYAESRGSLQDCGKCVGKILVPKGAAAASPGSTDAVREDQLPPDARVVRHADGVAGSGSNPNRLTLILDQDSRIVTAVWE